MKDYKRIKDPIYGYIQIPVKYMTEIVDTATFQRLRRIIQTSYSPLYSSAVHNRFVHSLGVFYLGELTVQQLNKEFSLKITTHLDLQAYGEVFKLACLLHDVGHSRNNRHFYFCLCYQFIIFLHGGFPSCYKARKKANDIIAPKLVDLYLYISEFLSRIEYSAKQESLLTGNPDDMDKLNIQNKTILCKQKIFINEQENSAIIFPYNILEDSNKYKTLILNTCNEISCSPNFSYCDAQIIHIISEIQLSTLWQILPKQNDSFLKIDFSERSYIGLGKGYQQLVLCHKKLAKFVEERFSYEIIDTTYEEREKWEKGNVEFLNNIRTTV